jgi:hypothetical protein
MKMAILRNENKAANIIMVLAGVVLTSILVSLAFYDHPSADDYDCTIQTLQHGFFKAQYYWYIDWYGRYFSSALVSLNPLIIGSFFGYKLMAALLIILTLCSIYFFINSIFRGSSLLEKLFLAFLFFFSFYLLMPSPVQCYYWFTAAYTYQTSNVLTLFLFAVMIAKFRKPSLMVIIISSLLIIAIVGSNEFAMFVLVMFLSLLNLVRFVVDKKIHSYYFILILVALVSTIIVFIAPGNAYRASLETNNFKFLFSLESAIKAAVNVLSHWWWVSLLIIFATFKITAEKIAVKPESKIESIYFNPFLVLLFIFAVISAGFFTCYWSLGRYPPLRTINNIYFYLLTGSVYVGACAAVMIKRKNIKIPQLPFVHLAVVILLMIYVFKFYNNVGVAYHDLKDGVANAYNREMNSRYQKLNSNDCRKCPVKKLKNIPKTLVFTDISEETDATMIASFKVFFKKDSIYVESN